MTENQRYLRDRHIMHVEESLDRIEAAGFELEELAEWSGGQPRTSFTHPNGSQLEIFGYARCHLYRRGEKVDGCKLHAYTPHTLDRVLAKAAS